VKKLVLLFLFFLASVDIVAAKTTGEYIIKRKDGTYDLVSSFAAASASVLSEGEMSYPNYVYELYDEPYQWRQWYLENNSQNYSKFWGDRGADISAREAWSYLDGKDLSEVIVAVLDTGVDYSYEDLKNSMWDGTWCKDEKGKTINDCMHGYDFSDNDKNPMPKGSYHGTHIAGIIAAERNGREMAGIAANVKIMALRADSSGGGLTTYNLIRGIQFAKINGAKIINASWGKACDADTSKEDVLLKETIADFPGLFINAAGNNACNHDDPSLIAIPSDFRKTLDNMIVVAASDAYDNLASFSDYGGKTVDVAAPGMHIYSMYNGTDTSTGKTLYYDYLNGTSMATPIVSGIVATLWGVNPSMTRTEISKIIFDTVDKRDNLDGLVMSNGRVNFASAVKKLIGKSFGKKDLVSKWSAVSVDTKARNIAGSNILKGKSGNPLIFYCDTSYVGGGVKMKTCADFDCKSMKEDVLEDGKCVALSVVPKGDSVFYTYSTPDDKVFLKKCDIGNCVGTKNLVTDLTKTISASESLVISSDAGGNLWIAGIHDSKLKIIKVAVIDMKSLSDNNVLGEFELLTNRGQNEYGGFILEGGLADEAWFIMPATKAFEADTLYRCDGTDCKSVGVKNEFKGGGWIAWNANESQLWFLRATVGDHMLLAKCSGGVCKDDIKVDFEIPDNLRKEINGVFLKFDGVVPWIVFSMWNEGGGLYFLKYGDSKAQVADRKLGFGRPQAIIDIDKLGILYMDMLSNMLMYKDTKYGIADPEHCSRSFYCTSSGWKVSNLVSSFDRLADDKCDINSKPNYIGKDMGDYNCDGVAEGVVCKECKKKGDYNCDGKVNGLDYSWWKQEFIDKVQHGGKWEASSTCTAVSLDDYSVWRDNYLK
jgi:subtilisin family serine protease